MIVFYVILSCFSKGILLTSAQRSRSVLHQSSLTINLFQAARDLFFCKMPVLCMHLPWKEKNLRTMTVTCRQHKLPQTVFPIGNLVDEPGDEPGEEPSNEPGEQLMTQRPTLLLANFVRGQLCCWPAWASTLLIKKRDIPLSFCTHFCRPE
jgi:hypothetical protein